MIVKMLINGHAQHLLCAGHVASVCTTAALSPSSFPGLVFSFLPFPTLGSRGSEEPGDLTAALGGTWNHTQGCSSQALASVWNTL